MYIEEIIKEINMGLSDEEIISKRLAYLCSDEYKKTKFKRIDDKFSNVPIFLKGFIREDETISFTYEIDEINMYNYIMDEKNIYYSLLTFFRKEKKAVEKMIKNDDKQELLKLISLLVYAISNDYFKPDENATNMKLKGRNRLK